MGAGKGEDRERKNRGEPDPLHLGHISFAKSIKKLPPHREEQVLAVDIGNRGKNCVKILAIFLCRKDQEVASSLDGKF